MRATIQIIHFVNIEIDDRYKYMSLGKGEMTLEQRRDYDIDVGKVADLAREITGLPTWFYGVKGDFITAICDKDRDPLVEF